MNVLYHPSKANVVANALSRLSMGSVTHIEEERKDLSKYVHRLTHLGVGLMDMPDGSVIVQNRSESSLVAEVKEKQDSDPILLQLKGAVHQQKVEVVDHLTSRMKARGGRAGPSGLWHQTAEPSTDRGLDDGL
ncbi:hypothetical protein MTR67_012689 [Solanum verrucosum]|uniref:Uncharacterized protein n=1 Tax=Solanum verrucosum TaxID=315347 RepID=A0AAF0Q920_SOLVR|nr:hypothetical protein MTR67_012689 [Solanum verrucosum]